jgi:hypothetical protein
MTEKSAPLFSTRFTQRRRTFFFDVKNLTNEKPFLKITSSSIKGEEKTRSYMTVFASEVQDFKKAMEEVAKFMGAA